MIAENISRLSFWQISIVSFSAVGRSVGRLICIISQKTNSVVVKQHALSQVWSGFSFFPSCVCAQHATLQGCLHKNAII